MKLKHCLVLGLLVVPVFNGLVMASDEVSRSDKALQEIGKTCVELRRDNLSKCSALGCENVNSKTVVSLSKQMKECYKAIKNKSTSSSSSGSDVTADSTSASSSESDVTADSASASSSGSDVTADSTSASSSGSDVTADSVSTSSSESDDIRSVGAEKLVVKKYESELE